MIYTLYPSPYARALPLQVVLLGSNHSQERVYRPLGLTFYQCFFCRNGMGEFIIDGKRQIIREGEGFLIFPGCQHEYEAISNNWKLDFIGFTGPLSRILLEQLGMTESAAYHFYEKDILGGMLDQIIIHYENYPEDEIGISSRCYELLLSVTSLTSSLLSKEVYENSSVVHEVIGYIEKNFKKNINLDDIANACNYSKPHLCSQFKAEMKETINNFLTNFRVNKAKIDLMQNPTKKVYEIAKECGYHDTSYFCKVFRDRVGQTPDEYRKSKRYY
ncbi:helix-turn-helix transcriptional regulator [Tuanshanicoccus lijuaniae]|uniref:AraC family transcriptional regulator n=1 Tax=Aerococcaceae bacterium zg-1292 TaxID=2774330 RepID=UPI0019363F28|nr:helix-turn-helix transcriptional regulator [Aerococcaceae bacterium zg-1292]QQA36880.1 helix-turn-helix transcriptional regulator [Aerococcaceae bacterium zg-1292]